MTDLPPLPGHPEPHTYAWTAAELRAIEAYGRACIEADRAQRAQVEPVALKQFASEVHADREGRTEQAQESEAFETWLMRDSNAADWSSPKANKLIKGRYHYGSVRMAWDSWQARATTSAPAGRALLSEARPVPLSVLQRALDAQPKVPGGLSHSEVRDIFLRNGFTIKLGQDDLKGYVYNAAANLILARDATWLDALGWGHVRARDGSPEGRDAQRLDAEGTTARSPQGEAPKRTRRATTKG